jgi:hypothetical protein
MSAEKGVILIRTEMKKIKAKAVRRGMWFKILTRTERACVDLAMIVVERVRSCLLQRVLSSVLGKLEAALESPVHRAEWKFGAGLALKLSQIAERWGHRSAMHWARDAKFVRFLAVSYLNS